MMEGSAAASIGWGYSQTHTSATFAAQATNSATVSVNWTRSQEVWRNVRMAGNIRRFWLTSLGDSFFGDSPLVRDSGTPGKRPETGRFLPSPARDVAAYPIEETAKLPKALPVVYGARQMPYALFCNDAKLSKAYPTEADVWNIARRSGLVIDVVSEHGKIAPRPVLDHDYEIRPCTCDADEDPDRNKADAERDARLEPELSETVVKDKAA